MGNGRARAGYRQGMLPRGPIRRRRHRHHERPRAQWMARGGQERQDRRGHRDGHRRRHGRRARGSRRNPDRARPVRPREPTRGMPPGHRHRGRRRRRPRVRVRGHRHRLRRHVPRRRRGPGSDRRGVERRIQVQAHRPRARREGRIGGPEAHRRRQRAGQRRQDVRRGDTEGDIQGQAAATELAPVQSAALRQRGALHPGYRLPRVLGRDRGAHAQAVRRSREARRHGRARRRVGHHVAADEPRPERRVRGE
mmetsp:Transcript_6796/g.30638  ORF Transcript_6796/g.30638 Transcript_6796/m.30638 type:complete len:252 (-) Transcript_6796:439-1194(-)